MNTRRLTLSSATAAAFALALGGAGTATSTTAVDPPSYVALGDSFSAGTGAGSPTESDCYRSPNGYPHLIADAQSLALDYQACSGATTADVLENQVGALTPDTDYVTITIGGNDLGFASVVTDCLLPGWLGDCFGKIEEGRAIMAAELPQRYDTVFGVIAENAPNADVRVGGYPRLFNGQDCHALTFFSEAEMAELNAATDELNALTAQRTGAAGFTWVDPTEAFLGHAVCDADPWINNLSLRVVDSFHPNQSGNAGYANVFWPGSADQSTVETREDAQHDAPQLQAQDGSVAAINAEADVVLSMELTSPANLDAARQAGVDTDLLIELNDQLASGEIAEVEEALDTLSELEADYQADRIRAAAR